MTLVPVTNTRWYWVDRLNMVKARTLRVCVPSTVNVCKFSPCIWKSLSIGSFLSILPSIFLSPTLFSVVVLFSLNKTHELHKSCVQINLSHATSTAAEIHGLVRLGSTPNISSDCSVIFSFVWSYCSQGHPKPTRAHSPLCCSLYLQGCPPGNNVFWGNGWSLITWSASRTWATKCSGSCSGDVDRCCKKQWSKNYLMCM